ncbi:trypsin-like peptidase domain-containing protein [Verrucomicrobium sp. BvORR034]|uniref:trypsin-like peptidase domain-containing protein n=1 Tax=Verrucomicrobium sp. BvORR034 TaxID=1396418 RepID=UPI002240F656|nr:trypsin-like peptidase domain-containing protein [Verrucomicrobium sp. BvORR034]
MRNLSPVKAGFIKAFVVNFLALHRKLIICSVAFAGAACMFLTGCTHIGTRSGQSSDPGLGAAMRAVQIWQTEGGRSSSLLKPSRGLEITGGMAFPVSEDGYYLTSGHVASERAVIKMLLGPDGEGCLVSDFTGSGQPIVGLRNLGGAVATGNSQVREVECSVVKHLVSSDLTILKARRKTPGYLGFFHRAPTSNVGVYWAANPLRYPGPYVHKCAVKKVEITSADTWFVWLDASGKQGDSGSPIVNEDGKLIGVVVGQQVVDGMPMLLGSGVSQRIVDGIIARHRHSSQ